MKTIPIPPTDKKILDQIVAVLKNGKTFCLSGHQNPDGDVIGSELAMYSLLKRLGADKQIDICNSGPLPRSLAFLSNSDLVKNVETVFQKYDVLIVFECSGADRMGNIIDFKTQVGTVINLDHHLHNPNFGHINLVEPKTSSTSELIYKIFDHLGMGLTPEEATCLYTGMVLDTGWFRYGNTNEQTHHIASQLLKAGVQVADLAERVYLSKSTAALELLAWSLSHMNLYFDNKVAILRVPQEIFKKIGATGDDLEDLVNYGLQIDSVCASALIKEKGPNIVKVSLRSKDRYDINQVARVFNGGGHKNASGCTLDMSIEQAEKCLVEHLEKIF
ncbi:MAG: DHH family phosphoesterase [Elusimicrobiota bacterium]